MADSVFTVIIHSAAVGVITGGAVGLRWIIANPSLRYTDAHVVALAERFAYHWRRAYTGTIHATIIGGAEVAVVAGGSIDLITKVAFAGLSVAEGRKLTLIGFWAFHIGDRCTDSSGAFFRE